MQISDKYVAELRQHFAKVATGHDDGMKDIVMVGAWSDFRNGNPDRLSESDYKYLAFTIAVLQQLGRPVHSGFNLSVVDLNETGGDFLASPKASDVLILANVVNAPYIDDAVREEALKKALSPEDFEKLKRAWSANEGRVSTLQSEHNVGRGAWQKACIDSGVKIISTFHYADKNEVNADDFDDEFFGKLGVGQLEKHQAGSDLPQFASFMFRL